VYLPASILREFNLELHDSKKEIIGKKGPIISTAIVAGVMAAKKTSELIPFCHPIPIEKCDITIELKKRENHRYFFEINCIVKTTGKTGVEMEALTGVNCAALCIYDMLKAVSHEMLIADVRLLSKSGGKRLIENMEEKKRT
jgi:cyclic pyranopterin phosphate synthase